MPCRQRRNLAGLMTADYEIRAAELADATDLAALWNPWISATIATFNAQVKTVANMVAMISERKLGYGFWVAESDGAIVGFATYSQFRAGVGYAKSMEHTIVLDATAHGRGIGRALMAVVERDAMAKGAHAMIAGVAGENAAGSDFHAKLGYEIVATLPQVGYKFDRFHDLIVMQKFLT
jgi:phosphinothricin acetyltransferase